MAEVNEMTANGTNPFDPMASWARLSERVENQGKDIVDLRSNMNTGFQTVNAAIGSLSNELRSNSKTQWPVIWAAAGVCFTVLATGGAFFYNSLSKGQDRLDTAVMKNAELTQSALTAVVDKMVTQKELEWRTARGTEDRSRMESALKETRESMQKQIDELKTSSASTYTPRDILIDNRERIDRLERQRPPPGG